MSEQAPRPNDGDPFDVVLMHGPTDDGEGARVLRARPGRLDAGEVRPMREGRPLATGCEVVRLEPRQDAPALYDVQVECKIPPVVAETTPAAPHDAREARDTGAPAVGEPRSGPAQVATRAYRDNWELTFGARRNTLN